MNTPPTISQTAPLVLVETIILAAAAREWGNRTRGKRFNNKYRSASSTNLIPHTFTKSRRMAGRLRISCIKTHSQPPAESQTQIGELRLSQALHTGLPSTVPWVGGTWD